MKLICPYCGNKYSIDEATRAETLVNLTQAMAGYGKWCPLVWEYTSAFATKRLGAIAPAKRLRIAKELARLWETGIFAVDQKQYRITRDGIIQGLRTVCDLEKFGFKNHNYLKKILQSDAERISAEGLTAGEEQKKIEDQKERRSVGRAFQPAETMTPAAQAEFKKKLGIGKFSELINRQPGQIAKREG